MKVTNRNSVILTIIGIILIGGGLLYWKGSYIPNAQVSISSSVQSYTSKDLKISFQYLKGWYVDDRYQRILLTTYKTSLNENVSPSPSEVELLISEFSYCFKTIEEDLIKPACGQGGPKSYNTIVSKQSKVVDGGTFYTYTVKSPNGKISAYYLLQNGDRILQISKQPDPSQFEKEFEDIINSIKFIE